MTSFHLTPQGEPRACAAIKGKCPYADSQFHFPDARSARRAYELQMEFNELLTAPTNEAAIFRPLATGVVEPKLHTLYEMKIGGLTLTLGDKEWDASAMLSNGRASYILFENLVRERFGLLKAKGSDHQDAKGRMYEQKSYVDASLSSTDLFHTAASSTFGANNNGPKIKALLAKGDYDEALALVKTTGFSKNDFYIYTNTGGFDGSSPLRVLFVTQADVLALIDKTDPRLISRSALLRLSKETQVM